jgi:hypothetical protein
METSKKITLATVKSFIKKNADNLLIETISRFNGMSDMVEYTTGGFRKVESVNLERRNDLGISGAWFVGQSNDRFEAFDSIALTGIKVSNSCGSFKLAIIKPAPVRIARPETCEFDLGGTGHGDDSYSDADPGL